MKTYVQNNPCSGVSPPVEGLQLPRCGDTHTAQGNMAQRSRGEEQRVLPAQGK